MSNEIKRGRFKGAKITFAESTQVMRHRNSMDRLIRAMAEAVGEDWTYDTVLVTDESSVSDFLREPGEVAALERELGFTIDRRDHLIDVALRLEKKQ